eukprot:m.34748 g.34748  ORF g.34748 m.34748 type:complete len:920 (-) comp6553_c0_seq1:1143-3902(-)
MSDTVDKLSTPTSTHYSGDADHSKITRLNALDEVLDHSRNGLAVDDASRAHQRSLTRDPSASHKTKEEEIYHRRRTVSDAAQWLRAKRENDLYKELLPVSAEGARQHSFVNTSSSSNRFCAVCFKLLMGIQRPKRCRECGMEVHRGCEPLAPSCLGEEGSIATFDPPSLFDVSTQTIHLIRVCIASASGLAKRSIFKMADPFAIVHVDRERFTTAVARKTISPSWMTERDMYLSTASVLRVLVFDSKKFEEGRWDGFLGMAVIPASAFINSTTLGDGATKVLTFRLRKRKKIDIVTGTLCIKVRVLKRNVSKPTVSSSLLLTAPRANSPRSTHTPSASEVLLFTSPGLGWQQLPKRAISGNLIPQQPIPPRVAIVDGGAGLEVSWGKEKNMSFTLGVYVGDSRFCEVLYSGPEGKHTVVGFNPGQVLMFALKCTNFYGSSSYSERTDPVIFPSKEVEEEDVDDDDDDDETRVHCPFLMAGFCPRGNACPLYHGRGMDSVDLSVAMSAVAMIDNEDVQLFAALQASMAQHQQPQYDEEHQTLAQRGFHTKLQKLRNNLPLKPGTCELSVLRADLFRSSMFEITRASPRDLQMERFIFTFHNEGGLDYGGLAREFFYLISGEVFDASLGMFSRCSSSNYALQINPASASIDDFPLFFRFVGRLFGLAILSGNYIDVTLSRGFFKQLVGEVLALRDLQDVDEDVHRSMIWILENEVTEDMEMYFVVDYDEFGEMTTHPLMPNGENVLVNESNKQEFVRLMADWKLCHAAERQMKALMSGFYELVPLETIRGFNADELAALITGTKRYNLEDWKSNTEYSGFKEDDDVILWLWEYIEGASEKEQSELLQFCTGSTRVPLEGFQALQGSDGPRKFCVSKMDDLERLPSAHTCFNRLELPPFPTKDMMLQRLHTAMSNAQGFASD